MDAAPDISDLPVPDPDISDLPVPEKDNSLSGKISEAVIKANDLKARSAQVGIARGAAGIATLAGAALKQDRGTIDPDLGKQDFSDEPSPAPEKDKGPYKPSLSDFVHPEKWEQAANYFADWQGLAKPKGKAETIPSEIGSDIVAGGLTGALAGPEAIVPSALSGASSGIAQQATAAAGGGPVAQGIASTIGGIAPTGAANLFKYGIRGGSAADMQANLDRAAAGGMSLDAAEAANNQGLINRTNATASLPGGAPIRDARAAHGAQAESSVDNIVENLAPGTKTSSMEGGKVVESGFKNTQAGMHEEEQAKFDAVKAQIPETTPFKSDNFQATLKDINRPTGIPEVDALLDTNKNRAMESAVKSATAPDKLPAVTSPYSSDFDAVQHTPTPVPKELTYGALTGLRSKIGQEIDWSPWPTNPGKNADLKRLYGSLSEDIKAGATNVGPEARAALDDANATYKANQQVRDNLQAVVDKAGGPEKIYAAATSGAKSGATTLTRVMGVMNPDEQNVFRATFLNKLGRPTGAVDRDFNPTTFLTQWKNLAPETKNAMFGNSGQGIKLRDSLDGLTSTLDMLKDQGTLNGAKIKPSAAAAAAHTGGAAAIVTLLVEHGHAAIAGNPGLAVGGALAGTAALSTNSIMSRVLTNPTAVRWMTQATKLPPAAYVNALNQLGKSTDPSMLALHDQLQKQQDTQ